ncbi:hypothetical protein KUTeg_019726 [Tegillarca granosa]|uniref:Chromosome transmission fidelity protein 8 n=1 Tax=Tegillarca granosa TaxID=220873 RepID=A0ABQ9EIV2_TEGGR|nr:hypothetical protein KUTeg_019726 [Tegillarca granosa]
MLELQGSLETRHPVPLSGRFEIPVLIIGHHILYGKVVDLEKPFAVLVKKTQNVADSGEDNSDHKQEVHYNVTAIIKKKLLFKNRPKPIIANVPKKL